MTQRSIQPASERAWSIVAMVAPCFYLLCIIAVTSGLGFGWIVQPTVIDVYPLAAFAITCLQFAGCLIATSKPVWHTEVDSARSRRFARSAAYVMLACSCLTTLMSLLIIHIKSRTMAQLTLPCAGTILITLALSVATAVSTNTWRLHRSVRLQALARLARLRKALGDTASLDSSITCTNCGYKLQGLTLESRCPECAVPVKTSLAAPQQLPLEVQCSHGTYSLSPDLLTTSCPKCQPPASAPVGASEANRQTHPIVRSTSLGVTLLALGAALAVASIYLPRFSGVSPFFLLAAAMLATGLFLVTSLSDREHSPSIKWQFTVVRSLAVAIAVLPWAITAAEIFNQRNRETESSFWLAFPIAGLAIWVICIIMAIIFATVLHRELTKTATLIH